MKQPKCTSATGRHSWEFLKNMVRTTVNGSSAYIREVGRYRCTACSLRKDGRPVFDVVEREGGAA